MNSPPPPFLSLVCVTPASGLHPTAGDLQVSQKMAASSSWLPFVYLQCCSAAVVVVVKTHLGGKGGGFKKSDQCSICDQLISESSCHKEMGIDRKGVRRRLPWCDMDRQCSSLSPTPIPVPVAKTCCYRCECASKFSKPKDQPEGMIMLTRRRLHMKLKIAGGMLHVAALPRLRCNCVQISRRDAAAVAEALQTKGLSHQIMKQCAMATFL